jgi:hypothetical protein
VVFFETNVTDWIPPLLPIKTQDDGLNLREQSAETFNTP